MRRRSEYAGFAVFTARYSGACIACGVGIAVGGKVLGDRSGGRWELVCMRCGHEPAGENARADRSADYPVGPKMSPEDRQWAMLVDYLQSCVWQESLLEPVPWAQRQRWSVLPLSAETVLSGDDERLPSLPEVARLFDDLGDLEAVFYGWPTVVALDDRGRPHVAPLFVRQLDEPEEFSELLPQVNVGLLTQKWFPRELLADAAKVLAREAIGFGLRKALTATARNLLDAIGVSPGLLDPAALLNPATLGNPWRPQEVGVFNVAMAFQGELDVATRQLIKDFGQMQRAVDWRASAARYLFENAPTGPLAPLESCAVRLNHAQEKALAAAATRPLTVITGPPGTGKSQTVTAIIAEAWRRGESVVLASTNNRPVDDVVNNKAAAVDDALVLRTGNKENRLKLAERIRSLLAGLSERRPHATTPSVAEFAAARHQAAFELAEHAQRDSRLLAAAVDRDGLRAALWTARRPPASELWPTLRRRAAKVVATRWRWLRARRARALAEQAGIPEAATAPHEILRWLNAEAEYAQAEHAVAESTSDPAHLLSTFAATDQRWQDASRAQVTERVRVGLVDGATALARLADTINEERPARDSLRLAMLDVKGWATTALSVRANLDCRASVVDLVVIDEASQCTLASVLPLAYRAKRLVIVGDSQQLAPVVTVDPGQLRTLAEQAGTSQDALAAAHHTYGEDSAFSAFAARVQPLLLDEHYRCRPEIIRFCNEQFYDGRLQVLTSVDADGPRGLEWREVTGVTEPGPNGGVLNHAEAKAVAGWVLASGLPADKVAVVTPFRAQARLIQRLLDQQLTGVRVGTAHTFQGGECDTVVFSTVLSDGAQAGTVAWLEGERNLINVAVSRARKHLVVFGNTAALRQLHAPTLLALAESVHHGRDAVENESPHLIALHKSLLDRGLPAERKIFDEGYPLGLAVTMVGGSTKINLEVAEYGPRGDWTQRQRQWQLRDDNVRRLGWHVVRVPAWRAYLEPHRIADEIAAHIRGADSAM